MAFLHHFLCILSHLWNLLPLPLLDCILLAHTLIIGKLLWLLLIETDWILLACSNRELQIIVAGFLLVIWRYGLWASCTQFNIQLVRWTWLLLVQPWRITLFLGIVFLMSWWECVMLEEQLYVLEGIILLEPEH